MKKIIVTILSIIYLGTSSGFTMYSHYCMDKLVGSSFSKNYDEDVKCNLCGEAETKAKKDSLSKGCCKNVSKDVKLDKKQYRSDVTQQVAKEILNLSVFHHAGTYSFSLPYITLNSPQINGPPSLYTDAIYLLNCVLLI